MTPTMKQVLVAAAVVAAAAIATAIIIHFSAPKDTPIVAGGGSIYGETSATDSDGWKAHGSESRSASLHASQGRNPFGNDYLTFANFDTNPGYAITGTGGWALVIRNPLPQGGPNPIPAVTFCSDSSCSAIEPSGCGSFNKNDPVYFNVRAGAQVYTTLGGPNGKVTQFVNFHDTTAGCTPQGCDKIYDVTLKTCNGGSNPLVLTCNQHPTSCRVTMGR
jgi:hypothetical protein